MRLVYILALVTLALASVGCRKKPTSEKPYLNVVASVIDTTGSFAENQKAACETLDEFISSSTMHGDADVYLYTLDAEPRLLKRFPPGRFMSDEAIAALDTMTLSSNREGTDVVTAIEAASEKLREQRGWHIRKRVLFVFSDGIADLDKSPGIKPFRQLDQLDWDLLRGMMVVFLYVDPKVQAEIRRLTRDKELDVRTLEAGEVTKESVDELLYEGEYK